VTLHLATLFMKDPGGVPKNFIALGIDCSCAPERTIVQEQDHLPPKLVVIFSGGVSNCKLTMHALCYMN
jgi:hypothetical protein